MTERSRKVAHDNGRSEGTAKASGWLAIAVATARLCNEVCGPKALELTIRFNAKLHLVWSTTRIGHLASHPLAVDGQWAK